ARIAPAVAAISCSLLREPRPEFGHVHRPLARPFPPFGADVGIEVPRLPVRIALRAMALVEHCQEAARPAPFGPLPPFRQRDQFGEGEGSGIDSADSGEAVAEFDPSRQWPVCSGIGLVASRSES